MRHLLLILLLCAGCDLGLDPDSLTRELRVLGVRAGDAAAGSVADLDLTRDSLHLSALIAAPTGPGRRVPAPRPVTIDWYVCVTGRSLISPGSLDPACSMFGPGDPDPKAGKNPALFYLASSTTVDVKLAALAAALQQQITTLLTGLGQGMPGGALTHAVALSLPVVVHADAAPGSGDPRDSETAFFYVRLVVAPPGVTQPPPNHNPALMTVIAATDANLQNVVCQTGTPCKPIQRDQPLYLRALATPASAEMYVPLDESGRTGATEELRFSWFSTDGQFSQERTGQDAPDTEWQPTAPYQPPAAAQTMQVWVVLQDDRYGTDWQMFEFPLTPPPS